MNHVIKIKQGLLIAAVMFSVPVWASSVELIQPAPDLHWLGSISLGPLWAQNGKTQFLFLAPEIEKGYVPTNTTTNTLVSGEFFWGVQKKLSSQWLGQLGLAVASTSNDLLQGEIWDDADPQFNNYTYQYKVQTTRLALKGKLLFDRGYVLTPWLSASLGLGFNRAHSFSNTPVIFEAVPNNNFDNHTQNAFSYTLGVGVQKPINDHWYMGVGYEFADWGKNELGRATGQTMDTGLVLNHLYTNGFLLNFTYLT